MTMRMTTSYTIGTVASAKCGAPPVATRRATPAAVPVGDGSVTSACAGNYARRMIDILPDLSNEFATQVSLSELKEKADIISLHVPITPETHHLINQEFISGMKNNFYLVNTARGKNVKTADLVAAIKTGKIIGAALDVLEYEKASFENLYHNTSLSATDKQDLEFLFGSEKVLVTPHIAGWTVQSKEKLAQFIVDKILLKYS